MFISIDPSAAPVEIGTNVTDKVQMPPGANATGQSFVCVKPPVMETAPRVIDVANSFVKVAVWTPL